MVKGSSHIQMVIHMMDSGLTIRHPGKELSRLEVRCTRDHGSVISNMAKVKSVFLKTKRTKKTKLVYVGEFRQGYRHGYGELTWQDESCYVGRFVNNNQEGYGCFKWRNKHKFEGEWLDNYMHGQGRYEWPDGTAFEGQYQMNLKHGEGTFLSKDGHQMNCRWVHGKPSGSVSFRTPHADSQPTVWNEGVMLSWATKSEEGTPRGQNDARAAFMPRASA